MTESEKTSSAKKAGLEGPEDRNNIVYVIFFWLGIGTLLPWNFFITVSGYWDYKYRNTTLDNQIIMAESSVANASEQTTAIPRNDMQKQWGSQLSVAAMVPNVTFLLLNAAFGHHFKTTPRLLVSLVAVIVLFGFTSVMAIVDTDDWQYKFLVVTLISVVLINISSAIFQGRN